MKAFLSHSSKDKKIATAVAKQLGRQFSLFDLFDFSTGEEFELAIRRSLDQSALFVLFASKNSLDSFWVKFESDEAFHRKLRDQISKSLVYIIDSSVRIEDLPEWLQKALVRNETAPKVIARDIRSHIDQLLRSRRHPYFVGRSGDIERLEEVLTPTDGSMPPRFFIVSGLPGVGRRSLVRHGVTNVIGFRKYVEIKIEDGDSINDICIKTADLVETYSTQSEFEKISSSIQALSRDEAKDRALNNLRSLSENGELTILVDDGGLLDNDGHVQTPILGILQAVIPNDSVYLALITHRRPQGGHALSLPFIQLKSLSESDTKRLVQRLFTLYEIGISPSDLSEIAEYIAGYPPSAYFAAQQARDYGVDLLLAHKRRLVEFRSTVFLKHIESLNLETSEGTILQLLSMFSPLPLYAISRSLSLDVDDCDQVLMHLIDLSLVVPDDEGLYRIADPIKDAASSAYGFPGSEAASIVAQALEQYLGSNEFTSRRLDLNRVFFRASRLGGNQESDNFVRLSADLIKLSENYYHERQYEYSIKYGLLAIDERPESINARGYLIRALVQLERWREAEEQINELVKYAPSKEIHFLRGFMLRRKGEYKPAISEYEQSKKQGRKGASIGRELAQCYFYIHDYENANKYLQEVLERHGDNRYVVDLWVQIASELGDIDQAHEALGRLEVLDRKEFYLYRKSRVDWRFGDPKSAREAIIEAIAISERPTFAFYAQAALCDIATGNLDEAEEHLAILDDRFSGIKKDIRIGLRCRLNNIKGNYTDALSQSEQISNKSLPYYQIIRRDAILGILDMAMDTENPGNLENLERELKRLQQIVGPDAEFDFSGLDSDSK